MSNKAAPVGAAVCLPPGVPSQYLDAASTALSGLSAQSCAQSGGTPGQPCNCTVETNVSPSECGIPITPPNVTALTPEADPNT